MTDSLAIRVTKVGGSLLENVDFPQQIQNWITHQPRARNLLIVGGGELVEEVRRWDNRFRLGDDAHWFSIRLLSTTARLLSFLLPDFVLTDDPFAARDTTAHSKQNWILDPVRFLEEVEPTLSGTRLPCGWMTTSDSIAARIAEVVGDAELVILKSGNVSPDWNAFELSDAGIVDAHFPAAVRHVSNWRVCQLPRTIDTVTGT